MKQLRDVAEVKQIQLKDEELRVGRREVKAGECACGR